MKTPVVMQDEESTRRRVINSILSEGPSTAVQLAERLELTATGIRRHLAALVESGDLIEKEQRATGERGRPAKFFALTDKGRAGFHHSYDDLALQALDFLHAAGGDEAIRTFANSRAAAVEARFEQIMAADPSADRADALTQALTDEGFVAVTQPAAHGGQLCQHHCPVSAVAEKYPALCQAETELFARILGYPVQRLATIAHGDAVCTTHIPLTSVNFVRGPRKENDEH